MQFLRFAFQKCTIYPGTDPNSASALTIIEDFCAGTDFQQIITAPATNNGATEASFDNFDFTIFKYPTEDQGEPFFSQNST